VWYKYDLTIITKIFEFFLGPTNGGGPLPTPSGGGGGPLPTPSGGGGGSLPTYGPKVFPD